MTRSAGTAAHVLTAAVTAPKCAISAAHQPSRLCAPPSSASEARLTAAMVAKAAAGSWCSSRGSASKAAAKAASGYSALPASSTHAAQAANDVQAPAGGWPVEGRCGWGRVVVAVKSA